MAWVRCLVGLALVATGCSSLPDVPTGACGNHVVDPGEECDTGSPGCSSPGSDAGVEGCRLSCGGGAACPTGMVCGADTICRRPTGGHHLTDPIGNAGDLYGLLDVDGDGYSDIVERGAGEIALLRSDRRGGFSEYAVGSSPNLDEFLTIGTGVDVARATGEPRPLVSVVTADTIGLFGLVAADDRLQPLVFPTNVLPVAGTQVDFRGGVVRNFFDSADPLFYNSANKSLEVYVPNYGSDTSAHLAASLDLEANCGAVFDTPRTLVYTHGHDSSMIVVATSDQVACVAFFDSQTTFKVVALGLPPMDMGFTGPMPFIVGKFLPHPNDTTGDWVDVAASFDYAGFSAPTLVVWPRLDTYAFGDPQMYVGGFDVQMGSNGVAAEFATNLDHLDDFATGMQVAENHLTDEPDGGVYPPPPPYDSIDTGLNGQSGQVDFYHFLDAAGDVNRDGDNDLVVTASGLGDIAICLGDGTGLHFTCEVDQTGLPGIDGVTLADVNGDSTTDVVVSSGGRVPAGQPDGGVGGGPRGSGISVVLGHPQALPDAVPITVSAWHSQVLGIARSPSGDSHIADNLVAAVAAEDGKVGVALGQASPEGELIFGFGTGAVDTRLRDFTGDGVPDLALLDAGGDFQLLTGTGHGSFSAGKSQSLASLGGLNFMRFVDLPGDPLPAVMWYDDSSGDQLDVGHYNAAKSAYDVTMTDIPQDMNSPYSPDFVFVVDLDGDKQNEIVILSERTPSGASLGLEVQVSVAKFPGGNAAPTIAVAAHTGGYQGIGSNPGFADLDGDGLLDLLLPVYDASKNPAFLGLPGKKDGTFETDPAKTLPSPAPFSLDMQWIASADLDGDGIPDQLFNTPRGAIAALADVERR